MQIRSLARKVEFRGLADQLPGRWVPFWYRRVLPRTAPDVQPQINVSFRNLDLPDSNPKRAQLAITALGQLRLGSIVVDGCMSQEFELPRRRFRVVFTRARSGLRLFSKSLISVARLPDWFRGITPGGPGLVFDLPSGGQLWIPCMEFFSRVYGRSQEIKRVLLTYPWDAVRERFFAPVDTDELTSASLWRVQYGSSSSRLVNADAVFLAHLRRCLWAQRCARKPYQTMNGLRPTKPGDEPRSGYFRAAPWFFGPAELLVRGFPLPGGSFLALRVDGASDPPGPPIQHVRRVRKPAKAGDDEGADADGASLPYIVRRRVTADRVSLASDVAPDRCSAEMELLDEPFQLLGSPRRVARMSAISSGDGTPIFIGSSDVDTLSTGPPSGAGKRVARAKVHAPHARESFGSLLDVWYALCHLRAWHPDWIVSVEWYHPSRGFFPSSPPRLVSLLSAGTQCPAAGWVRIDPGPAGGGPRPRGLLVVRVCLRPDPTLRGVRTLYLVEIERRRTSLGDEEKLKGLVFELDGSGNTAVEFSDWLARISFALVRSRGVFRKALCKACPGRAKPFMHFPSTHDDVAAEAAVRNALRKMRVELPPL